MIDFLYLLVPTFSMGLLALSILFKIYKRSVSTMITFIMFALTSNLAYYGYFDIALILMLIAMSFLLVRAMMKPENDTLFIAPYCGLEKRNSNA